ncbi:hypothetical protein KP509_07G062700 [Ceratopteris richardii]|uniref:Cytochrome P450 n=1 Tax=Ceratopteris richardii TaxID=49495 RepID=A0A8T2ULW7_CERRI|nr:hypothetical protein KP509_07G062700 [Ceratopteris richardii]
MASCAQEIPPLKDRLGSISAVTAMVQPVAAALLITAIIMYMTSRIILGWGRKNASKNSGNLPPGTMGLLPVVGESLQYSRPSGRFLPAVFISDRIKRYGPLFKSHIFGGPTIISTDAKVNQLILQKEGTLFKSGYPRSILSIIGMHNTTEIHGNTHKVVRNVILNVVSSRIRDDKVISYISDEIVQRMNAWDGQIVRFQEEATRLSFNLVINQLMGLSNIDDACEADYLFENLQMLVEGLLCVPLNLPGMTYRRSIQDSRWTALLTQWMPGLARRTHCWMPGLVPSRRWTPPFSPSTIAAKRKVVQVLQKLIAKKMCRPATETYDILDGLLAVEGDTLTREVIIDVMLGVTFAAYETTARVLMLIPKFLGDNPHVMKTLQDEHFHILGERACTEKVTLTWDAYKSMTFTEKVVKEALRLVNPGDIVFREAMEDVNVDGYVIPKGWKVMPCFSPAHTDPTIYKDPLSFNPWRWNNKDTNNMEFTPFGGGIRQCAGKELAKLELSLFVHHLVTRCSWDQSEEDEMFEKGLPIYFKNTRRFQRELPPPSQRLEDEKIPSSISTMA